MPLLLEIEKAVSELKLGKSPGVDKIPAVERHWHQYLNLFLQTFLCHLTKREWPEDWMKSVFVPIPKKGDAQLCNNNRTIAHISYSNKILL